MIHPGTGRFVLMCFAILAPLLAGACGGSGPRSDTPAPCTSGVWLHVPLAPSTAAMAAPTVQICRNVTLCYTSTFPPLPSRVNDGFTQNMSDTVPITGTLWLNSDGSITLDIDWTFGDPSLLQDGDHYVVTLANGTGIATTVLDKTATYQMSAAGIADSGPTCLQATLTP